jgi:uncharacterized protein YndB with AHSA1/START domain
LANATASSVIDAPIEKVWARIRDFNGLPSWHPRMVESEIEGGKSATDIGAVRRFKVVAFSDADHLTTYSIIEHPAPITNHTATLKLERVTDGDRTFAVWTSSFDAPADKGDEIAKGMAANVFQGGFDALKSHFAEG